MLFENEFLLLMLFLNPKGELVLFGKKLLNFFVLLNFKLLLLLLLFKENFVFETGVVLRFLLLFEKDLFLILFKLLLFNKLVLLFNLLLFLKL